VSFSFICTLPVNPLPCSLFLRSKSTNDSVILNPYLHKTHIGCQSIH
jgi:hypothetical protein